MSDSVPFTLFADEVPEPPESARWVDLLRWMVCVMDPDDSRLGFIAGCLCYAINHDGLSEHQSSTCNAMLAAVCASWGNGDLICQNATRPDDAKELQPMVRKH